MINGEKMTNLAKESGIGFEIFRRDLVKHGFILDTQEDYFSVIDNEHKAYLLGFIFGDGCVNDRKGNRQAYLSIGIQARDRKVLDVLASHLSPWRGPTYFEYNDRHPSNWQPKVLYKVASDKIASDLANLGVFPRKSIDADMRVPYLEPSLYGHFVRGFLDADGCISKCIYLGCTSSLFIQDLKRIISIWGGVDKGSTYVLNTNDPIRRPMYTLEYYKHAFGALNEFLYKDATIYLDRKKEKLDMAMPC
jgi:hypothetical protein